jgi:hypothetical protein
MNHVVSRPQAYGVRRPASKPEAWDAWDACDWILKLLERNTAVGVYLSQVFTDWLDLTHATLAAVRSVASPTASGLSQYHE